MFFNGTPCFIFKESGDILGAIEDFFKEFFIALLQNLLTDAAAFLNMSFSAEDGLSMLYKTPQDIIGNTVITKIDSISNASIVPIGFIILAYVLCFDLITSVINGNNFREFDTSIFFKFSLKGAIACFLMGNATTIAKAFFYLGSEMTLASSKLLEIQLEGASLYQAVFSDELLEQSLGAIVGLVILALLLYLVMAAIYIIVFVVLLGRVMEVMVYCSFAPIPIATLINKEWGGIGNNYIRNLGALAFQTILIMVVLGIFSGLMADVVTSPVSTTPIVGADGVTTEVAILAELSKKVLSCIAYGIVLCFTLLKTGSISKSIFQAH